jgi:cobalt-zinc-cadmium efflux system membrane fusion protein
MKNGLTAAALALTLAGCGGVKPAGRLEEKVGEKAAEGQAITMEAAAQEHVGLKSAPVRTVELSEYLRATGTVQPEDRRVGVVRPLERGRLTEVRVKVGDRVKAGEVLARMDNLEAGEVTAQLYSARAELQRARVLAAAQARQVERSRRLAEIGAAARKEYEQSRAEGEALEEGVRSQEGVVAGLTARLRRFGSSEGAAAGTSVTAITAPFAGVVTKAASAPGAVVEASAELFTVVDLSRVWVQAEVYEKDLGRLRVGQAASILVDTYPDKAFTGRVAYISDALDAQTRTAKVRCEVANGDGRLKLDMFATVRLPTTFSRAALAVPAEAIQQLEGKTVVFVQRGTTRFEARAIEAGRTVDGLVEVAGGLKEGELVVVAGAFHLKSIVAGKELGEE